MIQSIHPLHLTVIARGVGQTGNTQVKAQVDATDGRVEVVVTVGADLRRLRVQRQQLVQ
jgi:hypothetical protein